LKGEAFAMTPPPPGDERPTGSGSTDQKDELLQSSGSIPLLPPPGENDKNLPVLKLGETISFEEMGPIILNVDGTTRRIANWDDMTEQERETTWRRIKKRNEQRRQHLLSVLQQQEQPESEQQQQQQQPGTNKNDGEL
jgi:predicted Fe-S protein YdhL (DUF1289 family)